MNWISRVKIKDLLTVEEDYATVQKTMVAIADRLKISGCFIGFDTSKFYSIPIGDDIIAPIDYASELIKRMYDFADANRIWIE